MTNIRIKLFVLFIGTIALPFGQTHAQRLYDVKASTVSDFSVELKRGRDNKVVASHPDVVLHLLTPTNRQVASNNDQQAGVGGFSKPLHYAPRGFPVGTERYRLVAWLPDADEKTTVDVFVNGEVVRSRIAVGGRRISLDEQIPDLHDYGAEAIEIGQVANGATRAALYALDCKDRILAKDLTSGVGNMPRLELPATACAVLVGSLSPNTGGRLSLYVNDVNTDIDGDGLGRALERQVGTCDSSLTQPFCFEVYNNQDSDHDGLTDRAELLGIDDPQQPQLLSRWGANPLHKDLFVEVDYKYISSQAQQNKIAYLPASSVEWMQERLNEGSAEDLRNPDGLPGISLHVDNGISSTFESTLSGDWGGSGEVPADVGYKDAAGSGNALYFSDVRRNVFRYALMGVGGNFGDGNASGYRFGWTGSVNSSGVGVMLHELGHTLGMVHHGNPASKSYNCNPFYKSIMNYLYTGPHPYFSAGSDTSFDSSNLDETVSGGIAQFMTNAPFYFETNEYGGVDWNRDGIVSGNGAGTSNVRYPITLARDCGSIVKNEQELAEFDPDFESSDTPSLAYHASRNRLWAAWIENGVVKYRSALSRNSTEQGSCTSGQEFGDHDCLDWTPQQNIAVNRRMEHVDVYSWKDNVVAAFVTDQDQLMIGFYGDSNGTLVEVREPVVISGMPTALEPELALLPTSGKYPQLSVLVSDIRRSRLRVASLDSGTGNWHVGDLRDQNNLLIPAHTSPTVASWPGTDDNAIGANVTGACLSTTRINDVTIHCLNRANGRWIDVSHDAFAEYGLNSPPRSHGKTAFIFYRPRNFDGSPIEDVDWNRGEFWLMTTLFDGQLRWKSYLHRSRSASLSDGLNGSIAFNSQIKRRVGGDWTSVIPGTGISLVEHAKLGALKGLIFRMIKRKDTNPAIFDKWLQLLPFADATAQSRLDNINDFRVMEAYGCKILKGPVFCGDWSDSYWADYLQP